MKKVVPITLLLIVFSAGLLFAGLTMQYFTAKSNQDGILLEWKTGDEGGVCTFDIERSAGNLNNFIYINTIHSTGNNSYYSYQDNNLSSNPSQSIYYYRLKCIMPDGSYTYSGVISVVISVSGIKDTWGSIKAIFR
mgnify:CR=1 FL=1|jgi:hypothetical protein